MSESTKPTTQDRQEILEQIWLAQAKAIATILENTPPEELQAAMLTTARQFLSDNGINLDTLRRTTYSDDALTRQLLAMGITEDDDDEPQPTYGAYGYPE